MRDVGTIAGGGVQRGGLAAGTSADSPRSCGDRFAWFAHARPIAHARPFGRAWAVRHRNCSVNSEEVRPGVEFQVVRISGETRHPMPLAGIPPDRLDPSQPGRALGFRIWSTAPETMGDFHSHTDIELNLLLDGWVRYFVAGMFVDAGPGTLIAWWAALPHRLVTVVPGTRGIWATVPPAWFLREGGRATLVEPLLKGRLWREDDPANAERFRRWGDEFASGEVLAQEIVRLELEAHLLRLAKRAVAEPGAKRSAVGAPDHVAAMAEFIARHTAEDIAVADIAESVGLNPRYANGVFRQALGISLWEYLLRLRIAQAQRLLLTTNQDPLAVGFACGFGSSARFYATFSRITGHPPARWRKRLVDGVG